MPAEPTHPDPSVPRLSIAHLMLLTLMTAVSIAVLNVLDRDSDPEEALSGTAHLLHVGTRVWFAGLIGGQLALAAIVVAWLVRRRPASLAPGHWLLLGLGGEAIGNLTVLGTLACLGGPRLIMLEDPSHRLFFSCYSACELLAATVWLTIGIKTWRSMWTWIFLSEVLFGFTRGAGSLLIAFWTNPDLYVSPPLLEAGSQLLWLGTLGSPIAGIVAFVVGLIDRRYQHRDWLHTLGVTLMGLRVVSALLEYAVTIWRQ